MIRIELLGGLRVTRDATPLDSLLSQRLRSSVLVYLAAEQNVNREALLRLFWPDRETERARHVLSQMLYEMRRDLGSDCVETHGERLAMPAACQVDVIEFEKLASTHQYEQALDLYKGRFVDNVALVENAELEHWIDAKRAHYSREYRKYVRLVVEQEAAEGKTEHAAAVALKAAAVEPLEDEFHHMAIEMLAHSGKRAEALQQYESYLKLLTDAQLSPLDETVSLVQSIREGRAEGAPLVALPNRVAGEATALPMPRRRTRSLRWVVAVAVASLALIAIPREFLKRNAIVAAPADRVAVLPFEATPNASKYIDPFAFRAEMLNDLARFPLLAVAPRADVDAAASQHKDMLSVANATHAILVIDASAEADDTVRLTVRFWNPTSGRLVDTRTFQTPAGTNAAAELHMTSRNEVQRTAYSLRRLLLERQQTANPKALLAFDNALESYRAAVRFGRGTSLEPALRAFARADSLFGRSESYDPRFVAPTLLRAECAHRVGVIYFVTGHRPLADRMYRIALGHARRAVQKAPASAEALEALGIAESDLWYASPSDTLREAAQHHLQDAIMADSHRPIALLRLGEIYGSLGRPREQRDVILKALEDDPFSAMDERMLTQLAWASFSLGMEREAVQSCRRALELFPGHNQALYCELQVYTYGDTITPDLPRVLSALETITAPATTPVQREQVTMFEMSVAAILAHAGLPDSARAVAARARAKVPPGTSNHLLPEAALFARLGENERALTDLEAFAAVQGSGMKRLLNYAVFRPLRGDARFQQLVRQARP